LLVELRIKPADPVSVSGFSPGAMEAKGNSFQGWGLDMKRLASLAYGFQEDRIVVSEPLAKNRYDILVTTPTGGLRQSSALLKQALENAFNIRVSSEMRPSEVYVLSAGPAGTKNLRRSEVSSSRIWRDGGKLAAVNSTIGDLAGALGRILGKPVLDETQTETRYDFELQIGDGHFDRVSDALRSQLGITLRPATRKREYLIVQ
jgi:uncharacterized protein (TIGR03435 family)